MSVDMKRMRESFDDQQKGGGDFYTFDKGETLCYILPPCRPDDEDPPTTGLPYVPITVHYSVGPKNSMVPSLDPDLNPILDHPFIKGLLRKQKKRLTGNCPVSEALDGGELSDDEADEMRPQTKYLWGIVPLKKRGSSREEWTAISPKPVPAMLGKQIYDGVMEAFFDNGDITDPSGAILVRVIKKGEKRNTKYEVKVDPSTLKKPWKVPDKLRALIEKLQGEGQALDLFQIASNMIKSTADAAAALEGVVTSDDPDDEDDEDLLDDEEEAPPKKSAKKSSKKKTAKKPPPPPEDDEEDDEEELDDEEPEDDDDLEDEEDEEEDPPPKKSSKKTAKKAPAKKSSKKTAKKPPADDEDDEDDLGLDDLDSALDDLEE